MHFGTHYCGACKIKRGLWHLKMGTFYLSSIHLYLQSLMFPCLLCYLVLPWKSKPGALKLVLVRRRMCVRFMSSHPAASFWQSRFGQKIVLCKQAPKGGGRARGDMETWGDTGKETQETRDTWETGLTELTVLKRCLTLKMGSIADFLTHWAPL